MALDRLASHPRPGPSFFDVVTSLTFDSGDARTCQPSNPPLGMRGSIVDGALNPSDFRCLPGLEAP